MTLLHTQLCSWILVFPLIPFPSFLFHPFFWTIFSSVSSFTVLALQCGGLPLLLSGSVPVKLRPLGHHGRDFPLLYWDSFGKNQTPLQRNGMTCIPKIQNYPFPVYYVGCLFTCPCVWWFDTYWMVLKFYGRFQLKHFEIACLFISIQFWVEILFALRAKEYFAKRIKQLDHHLGD